MHRSGLLVAPCSLVLPACADQWARIAATPRLFGDAGNWINLAPETRSAGLFLFGVVLSGYDSAFGG